MLEAHLGTQWDPVIWGSELIQWALHQVAVLPKTLQPMLRHHLRKLRFRGRCSKTKVAGMVDLTLGRRIIGLQPEEPAPHALDPFIIQGKDLVSPGEEVFLRHPLWERYQRGRWVHHSFGSLLLLRCAGTCLL